MPTVANHIRSADFAITGSIAALNGDRKLLSLNVLAHLRDLVEGVAVRLHKNSDDTEYTHQEIKDGLIFVGSATRRIQFVHRFHALLQESVSHYTMDGDTPERLMLKYYEYLLRLRVLLHEISGIKILSNLEDFPVDLDPALTEYHEKICDRIQASRSVGAPIGRRDRYYIHSARPFFATGQILYEVVFRPATDRSTKFDRVIAFTDIDLTVNYAASLAITSDAIEAFGKTMPITIITDWQVSIRPCEFDNFSRIFGIATKVQARSAEYRTLMQYLTTTQSSLIDIVQMPDAKFTTLRNQATEQVQNPLIFPGLERARSLILNKSFGHNVIRYLMLRMNNRILKDQYTLSSWAALSRLNLNSKCKPFDSMPFCSSPVGHNARFRDLVASLDADAHKHELLARRIKNNVEQHGILYTPVQDVEAFGPIEPLMSSYNSALHQSHRPRRELVLRREHLFLQSYEDETVAIIRKLQELSGTGIGGYASAVESWLESSTSITVDDQLKVAAMKALFDQSRVALIHGAAGTGKSTMINYIANYFNDKSKLFLAHTNPAVNNLERRVNAQNSDFRTISRESRWPSATEYDLLVIDECSTVSNEDFLKILNQTKFKLLLLVGDPYQIASIQFGNWFTLTPSYLQKGSVFELTTPWRTTNQNLIRFWKAVRELAPDVEELLAHYGYSTVLDPSLFEEQLDDEIILCLNYDGLYGINNINRFLQSNNPMPGVTRGVATYKVGDPILFNDSERFRGVIYNNLKGKIVAIEEHPGRIQFDVDIRHLVTEFDVLDTDLEWLGGSVVRFSVYERGNTDNDDEAQNTRVPFQVAYAVSIHKAQGLEFDSVKIVITNSNEDSISHSIFYTAVTRARQRLKIFWTPETQAAVLGQLERSDDRRDIGMLASQRGLAPWGLGAKK